jgi:hypothetical protein
MAKPLICLAKSLCIIENIIGNYKKLTIHYFFNCCNIFSSSTDGLKEFVCFIFFETSFLEITILNNLIENI